MKKNKERDQPADKIHYATIGWEHIAQNAILPAFVHTQKNSEVTAQASDDPAKLWAPTV
jgi:hypothetical protein